MSREISQVNTVNKAAEGAAMAAGKEGDRRTERGKGREKESGDGTREGGRDHKDQEK